MKQDRLYADTSVFGGCFDDEFSEASRKLFEEIARRRFLLLVSDTTFAELEGAPPHVRQVLAGLPDDSWEVVPLTAEAVALRDAYLQAGIVGPNSARDAEHIAIATVERANLIVSWNFRHIVHFEKIRGYHSVNVLHGYSAIGIHSPLEVIQV